MLEEQRSHELPPAADGDHRAPRPGGLSARTDRGHGEETQRAGGADHSISNGAGGPHEGEHHEPEAAAEPGVGR